jgi:hypothetical protein
VASYGVYRGVVIDNVDPEGLSRLRVQVPQLLGTVPTDWAWPSLPIAVGVSVPAVNDPVWVMFEAGDINRPVWVGIWLNYRPTGAQPNPTFGAVVSATTYGLTPSNGSAQTLARSDHQHGTPSLTSTAPTQIIPDDAATVGVGLFPAREDHRHAIVTQVPTASSPGDAALEGISGAFARADHIHGREAPGTGFTLLYGPMNILTYNQASTERDLTGIGVGVGCALALSAVAAADGNLSLAMTRL